MERKMSIRLQRWKDSPSRMPIVLQGARQVGKTYTALSFGKTQYKNTLHFNLDDNTPVKNIFERDLNPERILRELSSASGQTIYKHETLIILDEIQGCEKALTSLKYFCEEAPDYHIIAAGSLLGVAVNREKYSFPVGKVELLTLYPLDFEEFLWALGDKTMAASIKECFTEDREFSLHSLALDRYKTYLATGGMPAAVLSYLEHKDFDIVASVQKNLNDAYVADMAKYASAHETVKIQAAYASIPAQLAKENKKFVYRAIKSGGRAYAYEIPIEWLKNAGIVIKCIKVNEGKLPLSAYAEFSSFKLYLADTGLLCSKFGIPAQAILSDISSFAEFKGALAENYVAAALTMSGYIPWYWESNGKAEVDFVIQENNGAIIPIEVKAADNVRSKSLNVYIGRYAPAYSIRISSKNFGFENGIKSVPLYAVFCV